MTQEILFSDMINHYSLKITELTDILRDSVTKLNTCATIVQDSWMSPAVISFDERIVEIQQKYKELNFSVEELSALFNLVKNSEFEKEVDLLAQTAKNAINNQDV